MKKIVRTVMIWLSAVLKVKLGVSAAVVSNQILQSTIDGLKNITRREISIVERGGKTVVSTDNNAINVTVEGIESFISSQA
ncbi:MAG: hypothetical protein LBL35_07510, partial [Clostridiales bacterium]|nr:hypothetical protein [Clostridiales bacterium]